MSFKGIVHPKMYLHSLSTYHYADRGVGEVFDSTKHFRSLRSKLIATESNRIEVTDDDFRHKLLCPPCVHIRMDTPENRTHLNNVTSEFNQD